METTVPSGSTESLLPEPAGRRTKHETLTRTLLELVTNLSPGERLPSQTELMRQFGVSDRTVLRSLDDLRREGFIVRRRGSGTYVADPSERVETFSPIAAASNGRTVAALALSPSPSPFYQRCLELLAHEVEIAGCSLICHHARHDAEGGIPLTLEALHPRGFVALNFVLHGVAQRLQERGNRTVILGPPPADMNPDVPCVFGDHDHGGLVVTQYLLDLGHRRLGYVRLSQTSVTSLRRSFRWRGHERAMAAARTRGEDPTCVLLDADTITPWRSNPALAAKFFNRPDAPTALIAWNDTEALPLLSIFQHAGLRVPEDISVVGYDALPEGAESLPPLTTVDQHLETQLRAVIDLLSRDDPPSPTQSVIVVPDLVLRGSCGPPRR